MLSAVGESFFININDNLVQLMLQIFEKDLKNNKDIFSINKINDLDLTISDHVANGSFKSLKKNVHYFDQKNYSLFLRNIDLKKQLENKLKYIDKTSYEFLSKSHLFGGEVAISNVADVGTVHRIPKIQQRMVLGNNQIFIKSNSQYLTDYLYVYFTSKYGQHNIESITSGSAQQKFNKTDFRSLRIPIPQKNWTKKNVSPFLLLRDNLLSETYKLKELKNNFLRKNFN